MNKNTVNNRVKFLTKEQFIKNSNEVPNEEGVFILFGKDKRLYRIGVATNGKHLRGRISLMKENKKWHYVAWRKIFGMKHNSVENAMTKITRVVFGKQAVKFHVLMLLILLFSCQTKSIHDRELEKINDMFPDATVFGGGNGGEGDWGLLTGANTFLVSSKGGGFLTADYKVIFSPDGTFQDTIKMK